MLLPGSPEARPAEDPLHLELRRVLVVDDALPVRRRLAEILSRAGVAGTQVRAVESPEEALEIFALDHADLVFTELAIGADPNAGLAMVLEMLSIDPRTRIVLVTAEDPESELVRRAVRSGVFAVLPKPLRHEKVRAILAEIEVEEGGIERFK